MNRPQRTSSGFTFMEILVALLLLASGIVILLGTSVAALRGVTNSYYELLAVKGAQQYQLELLRGLSFSDPLLNDQSNTSFGTPTLTSGDLPGGSGQYWVQAITPELKRVTVRVQWTDLDGRGRFSVASTVISKSGLLNK